MKTIYFFLTFFLICRATSAQYGSDYISLINPEQYFGDIFYVKNNRLLDVKNVKDVKRDSSLIRSFNNIVSNVTIYNIENGFDASFAGFGLTTKNSHYLVIYDFSLTQTIKSDDDTALVGVSVRMVANVKVRKAGLNIASPILLALNQEYINGALEVRVSGLISPKIIDLIPTPSDLSPSSITNALQAVASIKSHIADPETIVNPQLLAVSKKELLTTEGVKKLQQVSFN